MGPPADRAELVRRVETFPARLAAAATDRGDRERHVAEGEWTTREIVRHLIAVESEVWHRRLDMLGSGPEPRWPWTEPRFDDGPAERPLETLVATFAERRAETIARIGALDEAGWARSGIHERYGRLDVVGLLRLVVDHDEEHLAAIRGT